MQAVILAAGMGKRLKELTREVTKCMVEVNGVSLIERMLNQLDALGLSRIVLVIGYEGQKLVGYIQTLGIKTPIAYVENDIYFKTNNIYSLYLAREYLLEEDTLLLESDLIFEDRILVDLIKNAYPSLAVVAKYESWMDGTVVTLDGDNGIKSFLGKKDFRYEDCKDYYKTVNIYKFSKGFSSTHYVPFLEAYVAALGDNEYYEQVLKVITLLEKPEIKAMPIWGMDWYEIDDVQDLDIAESIFTVDKGEKLRRMEGRYGGYWRYPHLLDFCYLVNPFYPPARMMDELKASFERLVQSYPSGQRVNSLLAAKCFGLKEEQVVVGNGAAELIKDLMERTTGKVGMIAPTFEEYPNRKPEDQVVFIPNGADYAYGADDLMAYFSGKGIGQLILINPDNPTGNYLKKKDVLRLVDWAKMEGIQLVYDESFSDFASLEDTLLEKEFLFENPHVLVVKSISKSYGVPGLRLGILASGNRELIQEMKKRVAIWNINSFGEFYLQIAEKYQGDYVDAMERFYLERERFLEALAQVPWLRVLPTRANYVMCQVLPPKEARAVTETLLDEAHILIKDLSQKSGISGEYIRIAIKTPVENDRLLDALMRL
ncbi:aminotransferase class I/II-fold pyridoxal phosphate-dependent enzyme [Eubacteriales bacterium OttesenSCG-928-M02]|nr:aminotransferase class I/II-fold pyridoxal phosphate-dependent enzyme [Eubacteriales bacterium OttesenSCG-928-M02]